MVLSIFCCWCCFFLYNRMHILSCFVAYSLHFFCIPLRWRWIKKNKTTHCHVYLSLILFSCNPSWIFFTNILVFFALSRSLCNAIKLSDSNQMRALQTKKKSTDEQETIKKKLPDQWLIVTFFFGLCESNKRTSIPNTSESEWVNNCMYGLSYGTDLIKICFIHFAFKIPLKILSKFHFFRGKKTEWKINSFFFCSFVDINCVFVNLFMRPKACEYGIFGQKYCMDIS